MEPKYNYGKQVYIKKGFYRSFKAEVRSFEIVKTKNQKTEAEEETILYNVKIENVPIKDLPNGMYLVREDWLVPYRKYVLF